MTGLQSIQVKLSEARTKLRGLCADENASSDDVEAATKEVSSLESRERGLIVAGDDDEKRPERAADTPNDGQAREYRTLVKSARLGRFVAAAATGAYPVDGAEAELRSHLKLADDRVPVECLLETRAPSPTVADGGPTTSASIIDRLFAGSGVAALGIRPQSVGIGARSYPIVTGGATPAPVSKDASVADEGLSMTSASLSPSRVQASLVLRSEEQYEIASLEDALRRDLRMALMSSVDGQVLRGSGTAPQWEGLLSAIGSGAAVLDSPEGFVNAVERIAMSLDGYFARSLSQLRLLTAVDLMRRLLAVFANNTSEAATSYFQSLIGGLSSTAHLPSAVDGVAVGIVAKTGASNNAALPVWRGAQILRDPYSLSDKGHLRLTIALFANFKVLRSDGFDRFNFRIADKT